LTIIATVKTSTDLVVAADSKVTTLGFGGIDHEGRPIWLNQTYDYCTKIAFGVGNLWTAAIAGQVSFGDIQVFDLIENYPTKGFNNRNEQYEDLMNQIQGIDTYRTKKYEIFGISKENIPGTTLLFFSSDPEGRGVRAWMVSFGRSEPEIYEILKSPGVYLEGACENTFTLLYGHDIAISKEIAAAIDVPIDILRDKIMEKVYPPIKKIDCGSMPLQDAIDFATFLVKVEIQMKRFLPGIPNCGGPIDIAVVHGFPRHEVKWLPGKIIKHPDSL